MAKLTVDHMEKLSQLQFHPLISYLSISFHQSGNVNVTVSSKLDVDIEEIKKEIDYIFPDGKYDKEPFKVFRDNGTRGELTSKRIGLGFEVTIHMNYTQKESPAQTEDHKVNIQSDYIESEVQVQ